MSEANSNVIVIAPDNKHGEIRSANVRNEYARLFLDDIYVSLLRQLDNCGNNEERRRLEVKIMILFNMVQNPSSWYSVRDFIENFGLSDDLEKWGAFIRTFLYRLYKKGFLERRIVPIRGSPYEYRVRMEKVRSPEIFLYTSLRELIEEGLI